MEVVYAGEEMPEKFSKSIFLAGPTPRNTEEQDSWRPDALEILRDKGFDGVVFSPEPRDGEFKHSYDDQVDWEEKYLNVADCIVFWVPRDLTPDSKGYPLMAAFVTNVEFGTWQSSGKIVFGAPSKADKNGYLKHYADKYNVPVAETLVATLDDAMAMVEDDAEREGGERYVPLFIWKQDSFQSWYKAQTEAGNRLEEARLLYNFRPRFKDFVFLWVLHAKVYVASEDRVKDNEFVLARPDISSVVMWYQSGVDSVFDTEIVIVKEFRTPASTKDGFVRELPSGSSTKNNKDEEVASEEVHEETGLYINPGRFEKVLSRQMMGTFSSHQSHLYSVKLSKEEIEWCHSQKDTTHGKKEDTEITYVEVLTVRELLKSNLLDWSNMGMILSVISNQISYCM
jgi:8-oxo-dGTP pyrophosphatase MutT (NUDIX family)